MKLVKLFGTAALALFVGTSSAVYAQKGHGDKGGGGQEGRQAPRQGGQKAERGQPAQHQAHAQRTLQTRHTERPQRMQRAQSARPARTSSRRSQRVASNHGDNGFHGNGNNGHHYGQISDARYHAHFGNTHTFRMIRPRMIDGYNRFQYSGYWFGYNEPWPSDWAYTDHVYVEYMDNSYYLYNTSRPGIHLTLNIF